MPVNLLLIAIRPTLIFPKVTLAIVVFFATVVACVICTVAFWFNADVEAAVVFISCGIAAGLAEGDGGVIAPGALAGALAGALTRSANAEGTLYGADVSLTGAVGADVSLAGALAGAGGAPGVDEVVAGTHLEPFHVTSLPFKVA
jgi:hypothetical protein